MKQHFRISGLTGRLRLIVALLTLGLGAAMVIVILYLQEVHARASKADTVRVLQLADIASVELNVTRVSLQLRHAMLARTPAERQAAMDDITLKRKLIDEALGDYERRLYTAEGRRRFVPVPGLVAEFWRVGGENAALIQEGRVDDAFAFLVDRTIPARNALLNVLDETVDYQRRALGADIARIEALVRRTLLLLGTLVVATVLSLGLFAWWLGRRLYDRVGHTIQFASRVRDGDLSEHPKDAVRDEFTPLLRALEDMRVSLSTVVRGVRDGAQQVVDVTAGVTEGNSNLARRTVDQGRELQSTAINMAELSRTVQDNADQSTQAAHVADEATRVAGRGGEIMGSVVTSMRGISDTSRRIGDIIGTIDAIAFQTNILAINASVEAARAGSQGRGFAVVAGEVRSLAQRSGEAAREIKQLIGSSMEAVDEGARLVEEAGRTMSAIVDSIQRVQSLVGGINEASQAQRQGIAEVGASVRSLDEVTRENTALVNSAAESAQSVLDQARELVAHVSAFRLGGDDGSSPSGAPAVRGHRQRTDHVGMDPVPRLLRLN